MPDPIDLNPDGPHSPDHTAELGQLLDDVSRAITYATMPEKGGLEAPLDVYLLAANLYAVTGRLPQVCRQVSQFLRDQAATGRLRESQNRGVANQVVQAGVHLGEALVAARNLTKSLQAVQTDIAGLGVKENTDG